MPGGNPAPGRGRGAREGPLASERLFGMRAGCRLPAGKKEIAMKTILCYGDSNTWGYDYRSKGRFPPEARWPRVMQEQLGDGFFVLEEGLNGRTTNRDDPEDVPPAARNGERYLDPCLRSHYPLDLVIIMLGTNDLKRCFTATPAEIARDAGRLAEISQRVLTGRQGYRPGALLVSPIPIGRTIAGSEFYEIFGEESVEKSEEFAFHFRKAAQRYGCGFLDASRVARPNEVDAVHLDLAGHRLFGTAVAEKVREMFADSVG